MFAVFLKGGMKSMLKKAERLDNIMSVLFINHALYDFASKYSSKSHYLFTWPGIELKDRTFHPILHARDIVTKTSSSKEFVLNRVVVDSRIEWAWFAVNSRGEIILLYDDKITVIYSTGESKDVIFPHPTESNVVEQWRIDVAVDSNDNVYAVRWLKTRDNYNDSDKRDFVLHAFDENYNIKHVSVFHFLDAKQLQYVKIAVDKNQNLIMLTEWNDQVYICENTGKLKFQFKRDGDDLRSLRISNNNDIMIVSYNGSAVQIYSTEGNLKSTIKVPEGHQALRVAFHHGICKIIVLTYVREQNSYFLLGYSETGELENSVFFHKYGRETDMKSHPSGPVAVKVYGSVTFI
jgi:outer membrane protein assembly factor BamB